MEDLVQLLKAVQDSARSSQASSNASNDPLKNILSPETILVESKGMQHWLNLQLAEIQGIAMNYQFKMPASFIWDLARNLLGADTVPRKSAYGREVLAWRIDAIMSCEEFISHPECAQACHYWSGNTNKPDHLKRFQLATQLADTFEQYLLFRPKWLTNWEKETPIDSDDYFTSHQEQSNLFANTEKWQAWIWRQLVLEQAYHPVKLQQLAIEAIVQQTSYKLPKQIMIFAINTMAPQTLQFFNALSAKGQCNIHLFYLNPCVKFWGDIKSDKSLARQMREQKIEQWLDDTPNQENSLLANLGQQGKEFFNLLQEVKEYEISAFDEAFMPLQDDASSVSILSSIQHDILTLSEPKHTDIPVDNSIIISSSHSELREVQALHDYLLHQFNADPDLKPQDIVVMCPAIEDYTAYIEAVFRTPWDKDSADRPRLPCSIADRTLLNSEPLIASFSELLLLPDSRFEISKILDYLRLPAIQVKFGFDNSEIDTIEWWLEEASIHWAKNAEHKKSLAGLKDSSALFSWQWGLERLLLGFAQSDSAIIDKDRLLLPHVEGQDAILLGRLMQFLERLQYHSIELKKSRTAPQWQSYLIDLSDQFFDFRKLGTKQGYNQGKKDEQYAYELIQTVVNDFSENTTYANYSDKIDYVIMRHYLQHHFSLPDSGNNFLTGQVTFCSMIPMRSIPFKIIAILGLNDRKFPRQKIPISFDLMSQSKWQAGDRSRRADDRYLFLEALISARSKLYLSYQGRDIHKNSERQPSLILKELINYLEQNYINEAAKNTHWPIKEQALHPFSKECYLSTLASFDPNWKRLIEPCKLRDNLIKLPELDLSEQVLKLEQLVSFFDNPLKAFSQLRLNLKFETSEQILEDAEPFTTNGLSEYQIREQLCHAFLDKEAHTNHKSTNNSAENIKLIHQLSGQLPESPITESSLNSWEDDALIFSQAIIEKGEIFTQSVEEKVLGIPIQCDLHWLKRGEQLLLWRPASRKAKDDLRLWLTHLLATIITNNPVETIGLFFNKKNKKVESFILPACLDKDQAVKIFEDLLKVYKKGLCQPSLIHAQLGKVLFEKQKNLEDFALLAEDPKQKNLWNKTIKSDDNIRALDADDYFKWFYPNSTDSAKLTTEQHQQLFNIYQPLYKLLP